MVLSDPVKTQFGYHIIKITGKDGGEEVNFEEIKDQVKVALHNEKTLNLIQDLLKNSDVKVLYTPTPYYAATSSGGGGHGGMGGGGHGGMGSVVPSGHGAVYGDHGNMKTQTSPHGGASPHGGSMQSGQGNPSPHAGMPMPDGTSTSWRRWHGWFFTSWWWFKSARTNEFSRRWVRRAEILSYK